MSDFEMYGIVLSIRLHACHRLYMPSIILPSHVVWYLHLLLLDVSVIGTYSNIEYVHKYNNVTEWDYVIQRKDFDISRLLCIYWIHDRNATSNMIQLINATFASGIYIYWAVHSRYEAYGYESKFGRNYWNPWSYFIGLDIRSCDRLVPSINLEALFWQSHRPEVISMSSCSCIYRE